MTLSSTDAERFHHRMLLWDSIGWEPASSKKSPQESSAQWEGSPGGLGAKALRAQLALGRRRSLQTCGGLACPTLTLCRPLLSHSELRTRYHITAIPRLVILKPSGEVITDKGRKQIRERGLACFQNWVEAADIFQNFSGWAEGGSPGRPDRCAVTPVAAASTRQRRRASCFSVLVVSLRAEALICDGKKMLLRECPPSSFVGSYFYYS